MTTQMVSFRLDTAAAAALEQLAGARYGGDRTAGVHAAIALLAHVLSMPGARGADPRDPALLLAGYTANLPPTLAAETFAALQTAARRRLRAVVTQHELEACLDVVNAWYVTGSDAARIDDELEDAIGDGLALRHGVDGSALVAKLRALGDLERATLTLACREWWEHGEPRPPIEAVLGGAVRGPRQN